MLGIIRNLGTTSSILEGVCRLHVNIMPLIKRNLDSLRFGYPREFLEQLPTDTEMTAGRSELPRITQLISDEDKFRIKCPSELTAHAISCFWMFSIYNFSDD